MADAQIEPKQPLSKDMVSARFAVIVFALQFVLPDIPMAIIGCWIVMSILCGDLVWRSPWTFKWRRAGKVFAIAVIAILAWFGGNQSLAARRGDEVTPGTVQAWLVEWAERFSIPHNFEVPPPKKEMLFVFDAGTGFFKEPPVAIMSYVKSPDVINLEALAVFSPKTFPLLATLDHAGRTKLRAEIDLKLAPLEGAGYTFTITPDGVISVLLTSNIPLRQLTKSSLNGHLEVFDRYHLLIVRTIETFNR